MNAVAAILMVGMLAPTGAVKVKHFKGLSVVPAKSLFKIPGAAYPPVVKKEQPKHKKPAHKHDKKKVVVVEKKQPVINVTVVVPEKVEKQRAPEEKKDPKGKRGS